MCGITGLVCMSPERCREDHARLVARMTRMQTYRGPDDSGVAEIGRSCLGSNRLAILDLSAAGHMPMSDGGALTIVYNGEVYNFMEVREELQRLGHQFVSRSDTEVVMRAFQEWGEACLQRLRGMFAFAIHDKRTDTLTLVRDRFGKKPLYYMRLDGHVYFASELKVLAALCPRAEPNHQRLAEWALYRNVDFGQPSTLFANISSLAPGHLLQIRGSHIGEQQRYYAPESAITAEQYERLGRCTPHALTGEIENLLQAAVRDRLVSDVPVGTLCSGGIDSSLITALCAAERKDVLAFNIAVSGYKDLNENVYAQRVAEHLGIRLLSCEANGEVFRDNLVRAIFHSDHPLTHPNSVFFLQVSEFARSHGVIVLQSGEAADELFGGYVHRYRRLRQIKSLETHMKRLPVRLRRLVSMLGYAVDHVPITEFSDYDGLLAHATQYIDRFSRAELRTRCMEAYGFVQNEADRQVLGAMLADLTNFLTPLLRRIDRMTMAASVECRAPFLDQRLVETVINIPLALRLRGSTDKWVLKAIAAKYLPSDIVYRKKRGFPLPIADYLAPLARPELFADGFCVQVLNMHRAGLLQTVHSWRDNVNGFFNLLALEIWGRLFCFRQTIDEVNEQMRRAPGAAPAMARTPEAA
jgi:asparagine synthase (glutamine-hydrolysing)